MIRPAQHVLLGQGRAGEPEPTYAYPVSTGIVGLWDANEYGQNSSMIGSLSELPDISGNGNSLKAVNTVTGNVDLEVDFDSSTPFWINGLGSSNSMAALQVLAGIDAKSTPFTYVIRLLYVGSSAADRYIGFSPEVSGDPSYMLAGDNSMRFNNGSFGFPGGSGKRTLAVRNDVSGSCDIFVDGARVVDAGAVPSGAVQDRFYMADCQYVFAALHHASLSDAEIAAIHDYAIGA